MTQEQLPGFEAEWSVLGYICLTRADNELLSSEFQHNSYAPSRSQQHGALVRCHD